MIRLPLLTSIGAVLLLSFCACSTPCGVMPYAGQCSTGGVPCKVAAPSMATNCTCGGSHCSASPRKPCVQNKMGTRYKVVKVHIDGCNSCDSCDSSVPKCGTSIRQPSTSTMPRYAPQHAPQHASQNAVRESDTEAILPSVKNVPVVKDPQIPATVSKVKKAQKAEAVVASENVLEPEDVSSLEDAPKVTPDAPFDNATTEDGKTQVENKSAKANEMKAFPISEDAENMPELPTLPAQQGTNPPVEESSVSEELPVELPDMLPELPDLLPELPAEPELEDLMPIDEMPQSSQMMVPRPRMESGVSIMEVPNVYSTSTPTSTKTSHGLKRNTRSNEDALPTVKVFEFGASAQKIEQTSDNSSDDPYQISQNLRNIDGKRDYGIRLTAGEEPIQNKSSVVLSAGKLESNEAAIASRLRERPSYAEPADEYIIDSRERANTMDLRNIKKQKVGSVEMEDNWQVETQDKTGTFIYYNSTQGRSTVQSPDPVYIYAPRFRSVRQVVDLNIDSQVMTTGDIYTPEEIFIQGRNTGIDTTKQHAQTTTKTGRVTLIESEGSTGTGALDGAIAPQAQNQQAVIAQENRTIDAPNLTEGKTRTVTSTGLVEVTAWTKTDSLQVFIEKESASASVRSEAAPSIYTVQEGEHKQDVRIYKVASKTNAKPGETVDFIIYFENTGRAPVGNITLVDNLPTRLEIVEDSAESSVDSSFMYEINGTGSQTLRWEITQPLYAGEKGAVKFRALVR